MKINVAKLNLVLARQCKSLVYLRCVSSSDTIRKISAGHSVRPATAGRIAKALGVDVTEILEEEEI